MKLKIKKFKELFKNIEKNYPIILYFVVANFINAVLFRVFTTGSFAIRALFFDFGVVLLLAGFSLLVKKKNFYFIIVSIILVACCVINSIYYNYYSSFVSVSLLATSVFLKDFGDVVLDFAIRITDWIYLWELIGLFIVIKKYKLDVKIYKNWFLELAIISLISLGVGCALPPYTSFSRLIKLWNRVSVVNNFGVYVYQVDDIVQSLKPTFNNIFGYDGALKEVKEYYGKNGNVQSVNDYTGIFEGKNIIVIHAESLQSFTLGLSFNDEEVTPNLNKLAKEGIYFSNFYAQVGVGTSSDTEFTYATSLLPANTGTVFVNYYNNKARNIIRMTEVLLRDYHGQFPKDLVELQKLPGVGRKTANVFLNVAYNYPLIAVDTHVFRVSNRLKIALGDTPLEVEEGLSKVVPEEFKPVAQHLLVLFGRYICKAVHPKCVSCPVRDLCSYPEKVL